MTQGNQEQNWARVSAAFADLAAMPADGRRAGLAALPEPDRTEVERLLLAYAEEPDFLEVAPGSDGVLEQAMAASLPRQVGRYTLAREVGRGGMGAVYEAFTASGAESEQRRVALKLVHPSWVWPGLAARFLREQRVLGRLEHPGITRLYDSGATDDGTPYFVMEFVDGVTLDAWLQQTNPPLDRRVLLLLKICDAVAFAHRNLVVHRDIKPGNILVTPAGQPKLLDFGVAKILDTGENDAQLTQPLQNILTPAFASPEQLASEPVTTSSDVYSLGLLLAFLLTGRALFARPDGPSGAWPQLRDELPASPSEQAGPFAAQLRGDLDAIVLKCLRRRPEERYQSVEDLAQDLRAWLEHRPVVARVPSFRYRVAKFVRRNRLSVAAAAIIALAVLAGTAATLWQARIARQERERAQYRFEQIRRFSRSLMFELHDSIANMPGATRVRQVLVERSLEMLATLERDSASDPTLLLELAEGYRRLGNVQGLPTAANLGDFRGALASFQHAIALTERVLAGQPGSPEPLRLALTLYLAGGTVESELKQSSRPWTKLIEQTLSGLKQLPATPENTKAIALGYSDLGLLKTQQGGIEGLADYEQAVSWFEKTPADSPDRQIQQAYALKRWGALLIRAKRLPEAEDRYRRALEIENRLLAKNPSAQNEFDRTFTLSDLGWLAGRRNDRTTALRLYREALEVREAAMARDPKNVRYLTGVASTLGYVARLEFLENRVETAIPYLRRASSLYESLMVLGKTARRQFDAAEIRLLWAEALIASKSPANRAEARRLLSGNEWLAGVSDPALEKRAKELREKVR